MSSQLSAHAITAHTAMTRISVSRCSTLPAHRGSVRVEKCSTSFSTDIAILPSLIKGEPAQPVSPSEPARPFHASPLGFTPRLRPKGQLKLVIPPPGPHEIAVLLAHSTVRAFSDRTTYYAVC